MTGLLLGLAILVNGAGGAPVTERSDADVMTESRVVAQPNIAPPLQLPRDLLMETPRSSWKDEASRMAPSRGGNSSRVGRILVAAVGAVGGFYAGGKIGYAATADRSRDDDGVSGLKGVVIGAPIGAIAGALLGYHIAK